MNKDTKSPRDLKVLVSTFAGGLVFLFFVILSLKSYFTPPPAHVAESKHYVRGQAISFGFGMGVVFGFFAYAIVHVAWSFIASIRKQ